MSDHDKAMLRDALHEAIEGRKAAEEDARDAHANIDRLTAQVQEMKAQRDEATYIAALCYRIAQRAGSGVRGELLKRVGAWKRERQSLIDSYRDYKRAVHADKETQWENLKAQRDEARLLLESERAKLDAAVKENVELQGRLAKCEQERESARDAAKKYAEEGNELYERGVRDGAACVRKDAIAAEAACAAMREALDSVVIRLSYNNTGSEEALQRLRDALAIDAGRAILERLRAAEERALAKFDDYDREREAHAATRAGLETLQREKATDSWHAGWGVAVRERDEARAALAKAEEQADCGATTPEPCRISPPCVTCYATELEKKIAKAEEENARLRREWDAEIKIRKASDVASDFYKAALGHAVAALQKVADYLETANDLLRDDDEDGECKQADKVIKSARAVLADPIAAAGEAWRELEAVENVARSINSQRKTGMRVVENSWRDLDEALAKVAARRGT